jgi:hypothetical protein
LDENVSFLIVFPPPEDVCSAPGQVDTLTHRKKYISLPVQTFEMSKFVLMAFNMITCHSFFISHYFLSHYFLSVHKYSYHSYFILIILFQSICKPTNLISFPIIFFQFICARTSLISFLITRDFHLCWTWILCLRNKRYER